MDVDRLFKDAEEAFAALGTFLGEYEWFANAVGVGARSVAGDEVRESGRGRAGTRAHGTKNGNEEDKDRARHAQDEFAAQGGHQRDSSMGLFEEHDDDLDATGQPALKSGTATSRMGTNPTDGAPQPGMLDAAVFSYTQVILALFSDVPLATEEAWSPARRLVQAVEGQRNLVEHRQRILRKFYPRYLDRSR